MRLDSRRRLPYLLVAAAAILPRLAVLLHERGTITAAYVDKGDVFARTLITNGTYGFIPGRPSAYTQPLYGWFLVPLYWIFARSWIVVGLPSGRRLLELPSTHSIGMLVRALPRRLDEPLVHVYFHDTDLLDRRRALALRIALRVLSLRRTPSDLDAVQRDFRPTKTTMFAVSRG